MLYYGMEKQEYTIKYWETEEDRDQGLSEIASPRDGVNPTNKSEMIEEASRLFFKQNFAAVELEDEAGETVFHISSDAPAGEVY